MLLRLFWLGCTAALEEALELDDLLLAWLEVEW